MFAESPLPTPANEDLVAPAGLAFGQIFDANILGARKREGERYLRTLLQRVEIGPQTVDNEDIVAAKAYIRKVEVAEMLPVLSVALPNQGGGALNAGIQGLLLAMNVGIQDQFAAMQDQIAATNAAIQDQFAATNALIGAMNAAMQDQYAAVNGQFAAVNGQLNAMHILGARSYNASCIRGEDNLRELPNEANQLPSQQNPIVYFPPTRADLDNMTGGQLRLLLLFYNQALPQNNLGRKTLLRNFLGIR